jgi:protein-L-isoaspartate(D-aspartate) O-methyltransferase
MIDYALSRKNMVDCQLSTNGITAPEILNIFSTLPRELFLPESHRCASYVDEDVRVGEGSFLLEPLTHARMVQIARIVPEDIALNLGDTIGYSSAVLSGMSSTVVTLEAKIGSLDRARKIWADTGLCNIAVLKGDARTGCAEHGPYTLIFINGSVPEIPESLLLQITPGGRLVAVIKKPGETTGRITMVKRSDSAQYSIHEFFDACTPYVRELTPEPHDTFVF